VSNDIIDLIRRLPDLRYAAALAAITPEGILPEGYAQRVHREATRVYDQLGATITAAALPTGQHNRACAALGALSNSAEDRARVDIGGRALIALPPRCGKLSQERPAMAKANFDASAAHLNAEAEAQRELMKLLHVLGA
jgi:hypothetical protein